MSQKNPSVDLPSKIQEIFCPIKDISFNSLLFTDHGQVFQLKGWNISEYTRIFNSPAISTLISLGLHENLVAVLAIRPQKDDFKYLYMCTRQGKVKKTLFSEYSRVRRTGQISILLDKNDSVGWVNLTKGDDDLIIISHCGQSIRFKESDIKSTHRDTLGVRGIKLPKDDFVAGSFIIKNHRPDKILVITENGRGKMSLVSAWSRQRRGGTGIKAAQITHKTGPVVNAQLVNKQTNILLIKTNENRLLKVGMQNIPTLQRQTQGERLIRLMVSEKVKAAIAVSANSFETDTVISVVSEASKNSPSNYKPSLQYDQLPKLNSILQFSRNHSIDVLGLPTKLENTLKKVDVYRLGELYDYPEKNLFKIKNLGRKSVDYLLSIKGKLIFGAISDGSPLKLIAETVGPNIPTDKLINDLIKRCGDSRSMEIIQRRYGLLNGEKETLEEIGESYGITRERIRQIQKKAINRMLHPSALSRKPIIDLLEELFLENDLVISDEEADRIIPKIFKKLPYDGSSLLDLFVDLAWIQKHRVGDVFFYSTIKITHGIKLSILLEDIVQILRKSSLQLDLNEILTDLSLQQRDEYKILSKIVLKCCKLDPRIEDKTNGKFALYKNSRIFDKWVPLITKVLEDEGEPLHFTEISDRVNDLLTSGNNRLDQRRAHSVLIENPNFAHTGIKGTYGLIKWGIRKESTLELVKEYITNAGFPVHWEQIYHYVSKYKYTSEATLRALLYSKFENAGNGLYWIKKQ